MSYNFLKRNDEINLAELNYNSKWIQAKNVIINHGCMSPLIFSHTISKPNISSTPRNNFQLNTSYVCFTSN